MIPIRLALLLILIPTPLFAAHCKPEPRGISCVEQLTSLGAGTSGAEALCAALGDNGVEYPPESPEAVTPAEMNACAPAAADDGCTGCAKAHCCSETVACGSGGDCSTLAACLSGHCAAECPGAP